MQKLELVLVTGHTDRIGTQQYNQKLSERRADAVRDYLVSKGVPSDKIETLGMGKTQPVPGVVCNQKALKELIACLAPNRRVEVEVKGEGDRAPLTRHALSQKAPPSRGAFFLRRSAPVASLRDALRDSSLRVQLHDATRADVDLRIDARWIVPVEPAGALRDHALIVDGGRIVALVPRARCRCAITRRATHVALPTHVLIPGLVNAHTHAAMTLLRGIADDVPLEGLARASTSGRAKAAFVAPEFVHDGTLLAAAEMLRGGITCCNDMYFFPDAAARAYDAAGMRAMLGMPILDFPTPYAADADAYLQRGLAARDAWKRRAATLVLARAARAVHGRRRDVE